MADPSDFKIRDCILPPEKINGRSVFFGTEFVDLTLLAKRTGYSLCLLSLIFACKRRASLKVATAMAKGLGVSLGSFAAALELHQKQTIRLRGPKSPRPVEALPQPVENPVDIQKVS